MITLNVYFKSAAVRSLALRAAAEYSGQDGWAVADDLNKNGLFAACINCSAIPDAVETWAGLFVAFAHDFGVALDPSEIVAEYLEA